MDLTWRQGKPEDQGSGVLVVCCRLQLWAPEMNLESICFRGKDVTSSQDRRLNGGKAA